jgi:hypothetical protein
MAIDDARPCPCGSGLTSRWANDAKGIPHPPTPEQIEVCRQLCGWPVSAPPCYPTARQLWRQRLFRSPPSAGISFCAQSVWAYRKSISFPGLSYRRVDDPYGQAADEVKLV